MEVKSHISRLCEQIVEKFRPEKIVLFGSYAYGVPTIDSDIDLMVVMPYSGNELDKMAEVRRQLDSSMPVDVLVKTPRQIEERIKMGDFFIAEVMEKGKVLYEV
ncbi:MAG TPA: nucleotidyltransferase domain-containing protein [Pyrinomonadaceae bacterium]|nr:nucleotidyltransferase domain-containing protein [Pyrinomonadaceae bacterium]